MDNLSNADSCVSQIITEERPKQKIQEEIINSEQIIKDIRHLRAEANFRCKQLLDKLELLYSLEQKKETYDNIVTMKSIKFYEN